MKIHRVDSFRGVEHALRQTGLELDQGIRNLIENLLPFTLVLPDRCGLAQLNQQPVLGIGFFNGEIDSVDIGESQRQVHHDPVAQLLQVGMGIIEVATQRVVQQPPFFQVLD